MSKLRTACFFLIAGLAASGAHAQLNGHNLRGDYGLTSGTQPAPGFYAGAMYVRYGVDTLRDGNGEAFPGEPSLTVNAIAPYFWWVSDAKILGANYSIFATPAWVDNALEAPILGLDLDTGLGFADLYVQPINLGWHRERADFMAGVGIFAPTGRYDPDADDNTGLGMWSFEVFGGTTVYLDEAKSWNLAATAFYETHTSKEDSDVTVGDLLTIEGGLGKSFAGGAANIGVAYLAQWKITKDDLGFELPNRPLDKHRAYALGPEVVLPLASKSKFYGSVSARYLWELGNQNTTEGGIFVFNLTLPIPSISLQ